MTDGLYRRPLTLEQREEFERDLISFCDHELDLLGDITNQRTLYAGGASLLWLEGLSDRIGPNGSLTALEADPQRIEDSHIALKDTEFQTPIEIVEGSVFEPPFEDGEFDLVYSAGLFHELDVRDRPVEAAISALAAVVRSGGRLATSDFVDSVDAVQLEDEALDRAEAFSRTGARLYGIHAAEVLVKSHEVVLSEVRWQVSAPRIIRHLDKVVLSEESSCSVEFRELRAILMERVRREGFTRPATLYVEGRIV